MAAKRGKPKKPKGRKAGDITMGPVVKRKVRVPINAAVYTRKESEIAQLGVTVRKIERKIKPDKDQIRIHKEKINELTKDIEEQTEEREMSVREEFHFSTSEVRVLDAKSKKELERRTMTKEERSRTSDIEDEDLEEPTDAGPAEPDDDAPEPEERSEA